MNNQHDVLNCKKCFYLRILAIAFWSSGLVVLSLLPHISSTFLFSGQDKILHFLAYLLTAWLACRSLQLFKLKSINIVIISAVYAILLGAVLELAQHSSISRQAEWLDLLANTIGAAAGCGIFCLQEKLKSGHYDG